MLSIQERLALDTEAIEGSAWQWLCALRCAVPGIVQSFDPIAQTCVVRVALQEWVLKPPPPTPQVPNPGVTQNIPTAETIDDLEDVPICVPRVPGWSITLPIVKGTECLLIFSDMTIDGWWETGNVSAQWDRRRHDLSDAIAVFGPWSQPKKLANYSTSSLQIRSDDQSIMIELSSTGINIVAPSIAISQSGGATVSMLTSSFLDWYNTNIIPFLQSKGYTGPTPPTDSQTTILKAE